MVNRVVVGIDFSPASRQALDSIHFGSTAERVVRHAAGDVLIVKTGAGA